MKAAQLLSDRRMDSPARRWVNAVTGYRCLDGPPRQEVPSLLEQLDFLTPKHRLLLVWGRTSEHVLHLVFEPLHPSAVAALTYGPGYHVEVLVEGFISHGMLALRVPEAFDNQGCLARLEEIVPEPACPYVFLVERRPAPAEKAGLRHRMEGRCLRGTGSDRSSGKASQPRKPRRVWRSPSRSGMTYLTCSNGSLDGRGLPNDLVEESADHPETSSVPVVVAKGILVQVVLKVLGRDSMVGTTKPGFHQHPEPLDGVGVDVSAHVDALRVVHARVLEAFLPQLVVGSPVVGVDHGGRQYPLANLRPEVGLGDTPDYLGNDLPLGSVGTTLSHPEDGGLDRRHAATLELAPTVGL